MTRRVFIALACAAALWLGGPRAAGAGPTDDLLARVAELTETLRVERADKAALRKVHAEQTAEISALKRRRSSWRRDRELRKALAGSRVIAERLEQADKRLRELGVDLRNTRRALLRAIDAELAAGADDARRAQLVAARDRVERALRPPAKKIVLPSEQIDPLADADELADQSALLAKTAAQLEREEQLLERSEQRYAKMARLQRASARADEADLFDDDRPRRTTSRQAGPTNAGRGGGGFDGAGAPEADADDSGGAGLSGEGEPDPGFGGDPAVVLVDVVDGGTLDALRKAERSDDPGVKAQAAKRAREQVRQRRDRLERQRSKIEARIRALRNAR